MFVRIPLYNIALVHCTSVLHYRDRLFSRGDKESKGKINMFRGYACSFLVNGQDHRHGLKGSSLGIWKY